MAYDYMDTCCPIFIIFVVAGIFLFAIYIFNMAQEVTYGNYKKQDRFHSNEYFVYRISKNIIVNHVEIFLFCQKNLF